MNRLKIGFDAKRLFENNTGLGNYSRNLVMSLSKAYPEHEYHLFTPKLIQNEITKPFLNSDKFNVHTNDTILPNTVWRSWHISRLVNRLKLDIYHGLSHELPWGDMGKAKKLVTFHDLIWEVYPELFSLIDRALYRLKYRYAANKADLVLAVSKSTAVDVSKYYQMPTDKIAITYQSCGKHFEVTPRTNIPRKHHLYVGSIIPRKGLDRIIKAYDLLKVSAIKPLIVVGKVEGQYATECVQLVKSLGLEESITFVGALTYDALTTYYDGAVSLIYPSIYEGFGIPIIEARYRGCNIITSNNSAMPEAAGKDDILIDPMDINALAQAIKNIEAMQWSKAEEDIQVTKFSNENTVKKVMELYQKIVLNY